MTQNTKENDYINTYVEMIKSGSDDIINIIIEGKDDLLVYNEFEEIYGLTQPLVTILPVGGRNTALKIFKLLKNTPHINKVLFIVDQDQWVIKPSSKEAIYNHPHVICTHGYSFENDIFIDGNLLTDMEKKNPDYLAPKLEIFLKWYALEVNRIRHHSKPQNFDLNINHLFNCKDKFIEPMEGEIFPTQVFEELKQEFPRILRGKTLLDFYVKVMNNRNHCNSHTYSSIAMIEQTAKHKGTHLNRIFSEVDFLYKKLTA